MKTLKTISLTALGIFWATFSSAAGYSEAYTPEFVDTLVEPYLQMQAGLAADDLPAAQDAAKVYLEAMAASPGQVAARNASLSAPAQAILDAPAIQSARASFLPLSNELTQLVQHVGTSGKIDLYVATCPMAFGGQGGDWLQEDTRLANPYYGAMMLRCGAIKKQLSVKKAEIGEGMKESGCCGGSAGPTVQSSPR